MANTQASTKAKTNKRSKGLVIALSVIAILFVAVYAFTHFAGKKLESGHFTLSYQGLSKRAVRINGKSLRLLGEKKISNDCPKDAICVTGSVETIKLLYGFRIITLTNMKDSAELSDGYKLTWARNEDYLCPCYGFELQNIEE